MRHIVALVLGLTLMLAFSATAFAAEKYAVMNLAEAVQKSKAGESALKSLQAKRDAKGKEFQATDAELGRLADDLRKSQGVLSADARTKKEAELNEKVRKFQEAVSKAEQDLNQEQSRLLQPVFERMVKAAGDFAKKNGYAIVFDKNAVLWGDNVTDVTVEVTKAFDASGK